MGPPARTPLLSFSCVGWSRAALLCPHSMSLSLGGTWVKHCPSKKVIPCTLALPYLFSLQVLFSELTFSRRFLKKLYRFLPKINSFLAPLPFLSHQRKSKPSTLELTQLSNPRAFNWIQGGDKIPFTNKQAQKPPRISLHSSLVYLSSSSMTETR